jgi:hypothetical protein
MTPLTPAERDALRLRAEQADEVFSGRTVGELILDVRQAHADASEGLLGAALDAILAQCIAEPFEPWPGSLVAALVAPEQLAETCVPPAVIELQSGSTCLDNVNKEKTSRMSSVGKRAVGDGSRLGGIRGNSRAAYIDWLDAHDIRARRTPRRRR